MLRPVRYFAAIAAVVLLLGSTPLSAGASQGHGATACHTVVVHKLPKDTSNDSKVTVISFGIQGGNIRPLSVNIALDGTITSTGVPQPSQKVSDPQNTLKAVLALADTEGLFSMPNNKRCPGVNPDVGARFITVYSSTTVKHVQVAGSCMPRFTQLYDVIEQVAGVNR